LTLSAYSQEEWVVPAPEEKKISQFIFDTDLQVQGQNIYENYCISCHGNPGETDFVKMIPSPGDPASEQFQIQKDGSLFYKVRSGRGSMPGFEDILSEDEIWSIIAYMRSFDENYIQPEFKLEGVRIPKLSMQLDFDYNVDKLVVKVFDEEEPVLNSEVSAFIKGVFGNYNLGKQETNKLGIAYFDVDTKMPGDTLGNLEFIVKAKKSYGYAKVTEKLMVAEARPKTTILDGRHLWSTSKKAPIWLKVSFLLVVAGIWLTILFIIVGLRQIRKLK